PHYKDIKPGKQWYHSIARDVRSLNQQTPVLCNYFPHPDDEPLVIVAFKNFFRQNRVVKIGGFKKTRIVTKGAREVINISQDEKDVVLGVANELERLLKQRDSFVSVIPKADV